LPVITKKLAQEIAHKLGARIIKMKGGHDIVGVFLGDTLVAHFGIRRGSRGNLGHDYVPRQIFTTPSQARDLAACPMSRDDWVALLKDKGLV